MSIYYTANHTWKITILWFLAISIDQGDRTIKISKLLLWYACDFGNCDAEVLNTICGFIGKTNPELAKSIEKGSKLGYKVIYDDYDWSLNSNDQWTWNCYKMNEENDLGVATYSCNSTSNSVGLAVRSSTQFRLHYPPKDITIDPVWVYLF